GVDFREPLKPMVPADDQAIVLPWASVMVIIVLLKLAFTCATPELMFLRSLRRILVRPCCSLAMDQVVPGFERLNFVEGRTKQTAITPSSCLQSAWPDPCASGRWCACAAL